MPFVKRFSFKLFEVSDDCEVDSDTEEIIDFFHDKYLLSASYDINSLFFSSFV